MNKNKAVRPIVAVLGLTVALLCTSCAGLHAGMPVSANSMPGHGDPIPESASPVFSEKCSIASIIDWDGSAGPTTREGAVDEIIAGLKRQLSSLSGETPQDPTHVDPSDNPVILAAEIRSLEAVRSEIPSAQENARDGETIEVTAYTQSGQEMGYAVIQKAGIDVAGYRVEMYKAFGWVSDDPSCEE